MATQNTLEDFRRMLNEDLHRYSENICRILAQDVADILTEETRNAISDFYSYHPKYYSRHGNFNYSFKRDYKNRNPRFYGGVELLIDSLPSVYSGTNSDPYYLACKRELAKPKEEMRNCVRAVYEPFTVDEVNQKIVEMLRPADMQAPIELVFQSIEGLHEACPNHPGDWYFTGHYPTPGGNKLVNQAFINYVEQKLKREQ